MPGLDEVLKKREKAMAKKGTPPTEEEVPSIATSCPHCNKGIAISLIALPGATAMPEKLSSSKHPLLEKIEKMRDSGLWEFASDTLNGIYDGVEKYGKSTDNQERAIKNLYNCRNGSTAKEFEREYGEELF